MNETTVVFTTSNSAEAELVKGLLQARGVLGVENKGAEDFRTTAWTFLTRGEARDRLGDHRRASEDFHSAHGLLDEAVKATPDDPDLLSTRAETNFGIGKLDEALREAGLGTAVLTSPEKLLAHEITVFKDKVRIDVQTSTPGISFATVWERKIPMSYHGQTFFVVSKEDLVASKRAAGRPVDLEDVRMLEGKDDIK